MAADIVSSLLLMLQLICVIVVVGIPAYPEQDLQ